MNANEYQDVIEFFQGQLREHGLGEIANVHDVTYDHRGEEYRASPPKERLVAMLSSFERYLAARDPATLDSALERINGTVEGRVETVLFDPLLDAIGVGSQTLRSDVNLRPLREQIVALVRSILED